MTEPSADLAHHDCDICKQHDDHPKHAFVLDSLTGDETRRHMDCCAAVGCKVCAEQISEANGVKGHELRTHLTGA